MKENNKKKAEALETENTILASTIIRTEEESKSNKKIVKYLKREFRKKATKMSSVM